MFNAQESRIRFEIDEKKLVYNLLFYYSGSLP